MSGRQHGAAIAIACGLVAALSISLIDIAAAQSSKSHAKNAYRLTRLGEQINQNTLSIVSGNINGAYLYLAYDLSAVLDDGDELRILPVIGKGGGQNIRDVRFLKGVDLGITQSGLLNQFRQSNEIGNIDDKLVYITKLYNEEMHLVVRSDVNSIEELHGKKVNFSDIGSGTQLSTRDIFRRLEIPVEEVNMGQADAFEKLKSGEIAATVLIAGKPAGSMSKIKLADGFRFLPVPFAKPLQSDYLPAVLTSNEYPGMIEKGQSIDTIAVGAVLFAYNWPKNTDRYRRIEKFVEAFFPRLAEFQKPPRHPKWKETNLAAVLPGWTRFEAAEEWLRRNRDQPATARAQPPARATSAREPAGNLPIRATPREDLIAAPRNAIAPELTPEQRERLFQDFLKWSQSRDRR